MDGATSIAQFNSPVGVAVNNEGSVFVTDYNGKIRKIQNDVSTYSTGSYAYNLTFDKHNNLFTTQTFMVAHNHIIAQVLSLGTNLMLAGFNGPGSADGPGASAQFFYPLEIGVSSAGIMYVADMGNDRIRKIVLE